MKIDFGSKVKFVPNDKSLPYCESLVAGDTGIVLEIDSSDDLNVLVKFFDADVTDWFDFDELELVDVC